MNYRSVSDLNAGARELAWDLPADVDLVVGIPRSGLLAANLLCLHLDCPMTDVDGLCEGRIMRTGNRYDGDDQELDLADVDRAVVVDDSVHTGSQMAETRGRLAEADLPVDLEYAAVFLSPEGHEYVDRWVETLGQPRMFQWNLMHNPRLGACCVDIDGVLCRDPTRAENDDGEGYREFLSTVEPRVVPSEEIGWLVTCRLEKYREETEAWLDRHGIEYRNLVMMDHPDMEARQAAGNHAEYKAEVYRSTDAKLFIESSSNQAREIVERTDRPVFDYGNSEMYRPDSLARTVERSRSYAERFAENPVAFSLKAGRFLAAEGRYRASIAARRYRGE